MPAALVAALSLAACSPGSSSPLVGFGEDPKLPDPEKDLLPRVNPAKAVGWPDAITEGLLVTVAALAQVAALDPVDPATHRLLGGTLASLEAQLDALDPLWIEAPAALRAAWTRDRPVLRIADGPRGARLTRARAALPAAAPPRGPAHGT